MGDYKHARIKFSIFFSFVNLFLVSAKDLIVQLNDDLVSQAFWRNCNYDSFLIQFFAPITWIETYRLGLSWGRRQLNYHDTGLAFLAQYKQFLPTLPYQLDLTGVYQSFFFSNDVDNIIIELLIDRLIIIRIDQVIQQLFILFLDRNFLILMIYG